MENILIGLEERLKGIADDNRDFLPLWNTWCGWLRVLVEKIALNWNEIAPARLGGNAPVLKEITYISDGKKLSRN